jgi:hypothetical protein
MMKFGPNHMIPEATPFMRVAAPENEPPERRMQARSPASHHGEVGLNHMIPEKREVKVFSSLSPPTEPKKNRRLDFGCPAQPPGCRRLPPIR